MNLLQRYVVEVARRQQLVVVRVGERGIEHELRIVDHRGARADEGIEVVPGPFGRGDPAAGDRDRLIGPAISGHPVRATDPEHDVCRHVPRLRTSPPILPRAMAEPTAADDQDLSFRFGVAILIAGMRSRLAAGPGRP
jgi:hypothetical protein